MVPIDLIEILLDKYLYAQATHHCLIDFNSLGYPLSQDTVTGGLQRLVPLFEPLIKAMLDKHLSERLSHADETGWKAKRSNQRLMAISVNPGLQINASSVISGDGIAEYLPTICYGAITLFVIAP
ncbi:MAG: transposase [Planctomycetes bacterium]|nr:transposase [Planctomycetota bacterium]